MDIYSRFMIAMLGLVAVWYAHSRLSAHVRTPLKATLSRVFMVGAGVVLGYYMTQELSGAAALADFLGWIGLAHVLPAFLLFVMDDMSVVRS